MNTYFLTSNKFITTVALCILLSSCSNDEDSGSGSPSSPQPATPPSKDVIINKIHYNPVDGTVKEFVEIYNATSSDIDLLNWRFSKGINHEFTASITISAKSSLVLAKDNTKYADSVQWDSGELDNGGEKINLKNDSDVLVDSVEYTDLAPWPITADGGGFYLELKSDKLDSTSNDSGENWQATEDTNIAAKPKIIITEIHYHPNEDPTPEDDPAKEFVEIYNNHGSNVDISGWTLSNAIEHTFATSTTLANNTALVIAKDSSKYIDSVQWTDGKLSNKGGKINLKDANGVLIDSVEYDDKDLWPEAADGTGPSLELKSANLNSTDNDNGTNWQASTADDGSPGTVVIP
ncbi:MAG: hypothetical protein DRQ51_03085 [Gammaproteobacteria bacterium]|nr:MAG: hypothetical protein DRQ51_03085 [Gammaproteobacteria bacterium]